jgi:autotransporter passenger strand-loop-strand repeat protein
MIRGCAGDPCQFLELHLATTISGGTLEVASGGTASGVLFSSGGTLRLDTSSHLSGTISGFHLGDEIDLRGLAFSSSGSALTWKQTTSGANASDRLTVKEGAQTWSAPTRRGTSARPRTATAAR